MSQPPHSPGNVTIPVVVFAFCVASLSNLEAQSSESESPRSGRGESQLLLDVLPANEFASLYIRSLDDLKERGTVLIDDVGVPMSLRLSDLTQFVLGYAGLTNGVDQDAPIGISALPTEEQPPLKDVVVLEQLVLAAPVSDPMAIVERFSPDGEIADTPFETGRDGFPQLGLFRHGHLLLTGFGNDAEADVSRSCLNALESVGTLAEEVPEASRERINACDILLHLGVDEALKYNDDDWDDPLRHEIEQLEDADEIAVAEEINAAIPHSQDVFLGVEIQDGLKFTTRILFDSNLPAEAGSWLEDLAIEDGDHEEAPPLTLAGLPEGPVMAAMCSRLSTQRRRLIVQTLNHLFQHSPGSWGSGFIGALDDVTLTNLQQTILLGSFKDIAQDSDGMRAAIYPNGDGTFAFIAIFDTQDPQSLVATIQELADLSVEGQLDPSNDLSVITNDDIRQLVRQLNADEYSLRSRATTRLLLVGQRAVPFLNEAGESDQPEWSARARRVLRQMQAHATQGEQQILSEESLTAINPTFTYYAGGEELNGQEIDVIRLTLTDEEVAQQRQLESLLGSDWDRVRIVSADRSVVVTFGSVGPRLARTLELLGNSEPGLAAEPSLGRLPDDADRLIEVYLPLSRMVAENDNRRWNNGEPRDTTPSNSLTAFGFSATPRELAFDVALPTDEVRMLVVKRGWSW